MKPPFLLGAVLFLCAVTLSPHAHAGEAEDLAQITALKTSLVKAFEARDIDALLQSVHPDVVVTWQNGEVTRGHAEAKRFFDRMMVGPASVVEKVIANPVVEGRKHFGDQVISYGHMNDEFTLRGENVPLRFDSRFSALLVRDGGGFLLAGLHLSTNTFENPVVDSLLSKVKQWGVIVFVGGCLIGFMFSLVVRRSRTA